MYRFPSSTPQRLDQQLWEEGESGEFLPLVINPDDYESKTF